MWWLTAWVLALVVCGGRAAKQPPSVSGISQFWTDDYKVFDQIYGKTSDKELFGATLPPAIAYGVDAAKINQQASEKKERYIDNHRQGNPYLEEDQDPYGFGTRYPSLTNQALKPVKPPNFAKKFIPADFKPVITKNSDPETYEYLKHLELLQKKKEKFLLSNSGGLKPYLKYGGENLEESDGFRSIQDILEAQEANGGKNNEDNEPEDKVKYLNYSKPKNRPPIKKVKPTLPLKTVKLRCPSERCRKRATTVFRGRTYLTRPMLRKIRKVIYH